MALSSVHESELRAAKDVLENPGLAAKAVNLIGKPIDKGFELLPDGWREKVGAATQDALTYALKGALLTMNDRNDDSYPRWHKLAAALSGAAGGAFGVPALVIELPVSTTIICRSIADIARANGESLDNPATRIACLEVFALGGTCKSDDASESGYFTVRAALARAVTQASEYLAGRSAIESSAPPLIRLVTAIASRFQIQVSEKVAAQTVPVVGAAGGALINLLFIDHFQDMSRGHFTIRRLERVYGEGEVREAYLRL